MQPTLEKIQQLLIIHDKPRHTGESPASTRFADVGCSDLGVHLIFQMQPTKNQIALAELKLAIKHLNGL